MRKAFAAICVLGAACVGMGGTTAQAADGCSYTGYGQVYCEPGAQPGVPYGYYGDTYYRGPYYRHRYYEPDPGAAVAMGILGAAAGAIAHQAYHHRRHRHHQR